MSLVALFVVYLKNNDYLEYTTDEQLHDLGKFMFAFSVFWTYLWYSQFMLIWYANIPEETVYFLRRNTESWQILSTALVVGHFFVPFLLLLPNLGKKKPAFLCGKAIWILLMHLLDIYVIVLPAIHKAGFTPSPLDVLCILAIGSTLAAVFLKRLGDAPLWPLRDPRLPQSIALKN